MTKVALPVVFERRFQFWWYTVSLARAVLRRFPSPEDGTTTSVEIMFQGVQALQLRSVYRRIAMRHATPDEAEVIVDQLDKIPGHPTLFVVLGDDLRAGWVACSVCFTDENDLDYIHKPALLIDGMWIPSRLDLDCHSKRGANRHERRGASSDDVPARSRRNSPEALLRS